MRYKRINSGRVLLGDGTREPHTNHKSRQGRAQTTEAKSAETGRKANRRASSSSSGRHDKANREERPIDMYRATLAAYNRAVSAALDAQNEVRDYFIALKALKQDGVVIGRRDGQALLGALNKAFSGLERLTEGLCCEVETYQGEKVHVRLTYQEERFDRGPSRRNYAPPFALVAKKVVNDMDGRLYVPASARAIHAGHSSAEGNERREIPREIPLTQIDKLKVLSYGDALRSLGHPARVQNTRDSEFYQRRLSPQIAGINEARQVLQEVKERLPHQLDAAFYIHRELRLG